jgi:hypothetical protein
MLSARGIKSTPTRRDLDLKMRFILNGVLWVLVLLPVEKTSLNQVTPSTAVLLMVTLILLVIRRSLARNVVYTIMLLRIAVGCSVRFVSSIIEPLTAKDVSHGMLDLNCVLLK